MKPSQPREETEAAARTLLVVTLAMEDAVTRQSRREIDCLVRRRQELLTRLSGATLSPNMVALLTTASEAGKRAISSLEASRAALGKRLRDIHQRKRARLAYKAAFVAPRWEHRS